MGNLAADLRYALRMMRKNLGVTAIILIAVALGIGANTAIFTVVDSVLLQPLPYPQPDRIMKLGRQSKPGISYSTSIPKYMAWRRNDVFEALALYDFGALSMTLGSGTPPQQATVLHVSMDYFKVFGVAPIVGRTFVPSEDLPGGPDVAVISSGLWQSRFGADSNVSGRALLLNGTPYTIVGVLPASFHSDPRAEVWIPIQADPNSANQGHYLLVAGRLKPGVTVATAQAQMKVVGDQFRKEHPKFMDDDESVGVRTMRDATTGEVRTALLVLWGAVALVLLIACANVANLLLSRAAGRQREMAVRAALGASRWRVVRQLLTESLLLAGCGGLLGFALGAWGVRALLLLIPGDIPRLTDVDGGTAAIPLLDWRVASFTIALSALTGLIFGLFPALQISKPDLTSALKEGDRSGSSLRHNRARSLLVVAEVALALVLLVGATLLIRTFAGLRSADPGIDPRSVLTFQTSLAGSSYETTATVDGLTVQAVRRLESVPGVLAAASTIALPVEASIDLPFAIAGRPPTKDDYTGEEQWRSVSPNYFNVFKVPVLRGRTFAETDRGTSPRVVIINDAMAKKYWPKENPIGQTIVIGKGLGPQFEDPPRQIVGIVANVRENGMENEGVGVMYIPQSQMPEGLTALANSVIPLAWAVRTAGEPASLRAAIEKELRLVDGQLPVSRVRTMEQVIAEAISRQNFNMILLSVFAGIALLLAASGIYGVMSYSVQQRTQEIGIRMALGAGRGGVLKLILGHGMKLAGLGVATGLALAYGLTRVLASLLFGVKASDPLTFGLVAGMLALTALVAAYIPARRATALDPAMALRYQ